VFGPEAAGLFFGLPGKARDGFLICSQPGRGDPQKGPRVSQERREGSEGSWRSFRFNPGLGLEGGPCPGGNRRLENRGEPMVPGVPATLPGAIVVRKVLSKTRTGLEGPAWGLLGRFPN